MRIQAPPSSPGNLRPSWRRPFHWPLPARPPIPIKGQLSAPIWKFKAASGAPCEWVSTCFLRRFRFKRLLDKCSARLYSFHWFQLDWAAMVVQHRKPANIASEINKLSVRSGLLAKAQYPITGDLSWPKSPCKVRSLQPVGHGSLCNEASAWHDRFRILNSILRRQDSLFHRQLQLPAARGRQVTYAPRRQQYE